MKNILYEADQIINNRSEEADRQYGPIDHSMEKASSLFNIMSDSHIKLDVKHMYYAMIALKLSRESHRHKEDNLLDACAYMGALNNYLEKTKQ